MRERDGCLFLPSRDLFLLKLLYFPKEALQANELLFIFTWDISRVVFCKPKKFLFPDTRGNQARPKRVTRYVHALTLSQHRQTVKVKSKVKSKVGGNDKQKTSGVVVATFTFTFFIFITITITIIIIFITIIISVLRSQVFVRRRRIIWCTRNTGG